MRVKLAEITWTNPSKTDEGQTDRSRVTLFHDQGYLLEVACNDVKRSLFCLKPAKEWFLDKGRLSLEYRVYADTDREVCSVMEQLGLAPDTVANGARSLKKG